MKNGATYSLPQFDEESSLKNFVKFYFYFYNLQVPNFIEPTPILWTLILSWELEQIQ